MLRGNTMKYYVVTFTHTKIVGWAIFLHAHVKYLEKLLSEKKLRAAGVYVNNPAAGLSILSVADAAEAEAIMKEDPYVKNLGASYQVIQWDPKFGEFK